MNTPLEEKVTLKAIGDLIERSVSKLATKVEVSKLATKDELNTAVSKLATKDELNNAVSKLATKDELRVAVSKLATKEELKETVEKAVDDLAGAVKKGFDEIHEKIDKIEFKIERMDTRFTNQLDYISLWYPSKSEFTELDNRVKKIEKKVGIKA